MIRNVVPVVALSGHCLRLGFDDGATGEVAVALLVLFEGVFGPLADPVLFGEMRVDGELGTIAGPNGADTDPIVLYCQTIGRPLPTHATPAA